MTPTGARLFVGVEPPAAVRAELAAFAAAAGEVDPALRPVAPEALHVTLAFLGQRDLRDVGPAAAAVRAATPARPIALELGGALWLSPRRPHVLAVRIGDPDGALAELQRMVADGLAGAIDWRPERRAFLAHLTVARVRRGSRPRRCDLPVLPRGGFDAAALTLYRSHLGGRAARYEALERVAL